jgi:hypothetical protein
MQKRKVKNVLRALPKSELLKYLKTAVESAEPSMRAFMHTTSDDKCRLHALMADRRLVDVVARTTEVLDRQELDDKSMRGAHWEDLALAFNNYELYSYDHCMMDPAAAVPVPTEEFTTVYEHCHDVNPANKDRPPRDGAWIKRLWRELKSKFATAYAGFKKSGNQDMEDRYADFWGYCGGDICTLYGFAVNAAADMSTVFGKELDRGGLDSLTTATTPESVSTSTRKRRQQTDLSDSEETLIKLQAVKDVVNLRKQNSDQKFAMEMSTCAGVSVKTRDLAREYLEKRMEEVSATYSTRRPPLAPRRANAMTPRRKSVLVNTDTDDLSSPDSIPDSASTMFDEV